MEHVITRRCARAAFSLVELAVVLVVLGLLVGGIMAGQSLRDSAQMQGAVAELGRYKAAIMQFRAQYQSWPGDYASATTQWGSAGGTGADATCFTTSSATAATCNGNGNGVTNTAAGAAAGDTWYYGERLHAWKHLAGAGMIEGKFTGVAGAGGNTDFEGGSNVPRSSLSGYGYMFGYISAVGTLYQRDANDYEYLGHVLAPWHRASGGLLTTSQAKYIDDKLDDGRPGTGLVTGIQACGSTAAKYTAEYAISTGGLVCTLYYYLRESDTIGGG